MGIIIDLSHTLCKGILTKMKSFLIFCGTVLLVHSKSASGSYTFKDGNRCINMWDEGCINGQLPGAGQDDDFINGGFNPGKRCVNMWDDGCVNGQLPGAGQDDDFINGGFNPGKRCVGANCNEHVSRGKSGINYDMQIIYKLLSKINRKHN